MQVLGIMGALSCGKTTAAKHLVDHHGWTRIRMAETLKQMLMHMGLTVEEVDGDLKGWPCELLGGATPRLAMQTLGTEWRDMICKDLWVRCMRKNIANLHSHNHPIKIVIDDIRFPWEVDMVREFNGKLWLVRRPDVEPSAPTRWVEFIQRFGFGPPRLHKSETYWRDEFIEFDAVLRNSGYTLDGFRAIVDQFAVAQL